MIRLRDDVQSRHTRYRRSCTRDEDDPIESDAKVLWWKLDPDAAL